MDKIKEEHCKFVLEMKYINLWSYEKIADTLGYEIRQIYRLQKKGFEVLDDYLSLKSQDRLKI